MDRLPSLRLLGVFETLARHGSMRGAAQELNVSQPAISQALRGLEDHVGVLLLDRATRPARLTPAGARLAQAIRDGMGGIASAIATIRAEAGTDDATVTAACTIGMATHWLMPRLSQFYAEHPDILVNVQAVPSDMTALQPGVDVILRYGSDRWDDGETTHLFQERVCPVGRPDLIGRLLTDGTGLSTAPLIDVTRESSANWAGWREYFALRRLPAPRPPRLRFNTYVQAVQSALDGQGLMLGWRSITSSFVAEGLLREWPEGEVSFGTSYTMTVAPAAANRPVCQAFAQWIIGRCRNWD